MNTAIIIHAKEQVARLAIVWKVIGERTDNLTELVRIGGTDCSLHAVAFQICKQCSYFAAWYHNVKIYYNI